MSTEQHPPAPNRRDLMKGAMTAAGVATVAGLWFEGFGDVSRRRRIEPTQPGAPLKALSEARMRALEAAQDRLLPSDGPTSPGARDVNAAGYLDALLARNELTKESQRKIVEGLDGLDAMARAVARQRGIGAREFCELAPDVQDEILRSYEESRGGILWLRLVLEFTLEAFFGDPVHGGNPNEIGWKWARHRPGTPRPTQPGWRLREIE